MSDRARSSVRTGARDGSGTSDGVSEAAAPVDGGPDATTSSPGGRGSRGASKASGGPAEAAAKTQQARPADAEPADGPARPDTTAVAPPAAAPAPPAAHPVTPLAPAGSRPAGDGARPAGNPGPPVPPAGGRSAGARSGVPAGGQLPADSTQAVTLPPAAARPADPSSRPADPASRPSAARAAEARGKARGAGKGPRRARLQLRHIDTWSALKISLVVSIALFFVWMIAVAILYGVLGGLGVFDTLNDLIGQLGSASGDTSGGASEVISAKVVLGGAAVIGAVNIVLLTALCTVAAFIYNLCSDLVGGLEVTLAERD